MNERSYDWKHVIFDYKPRGMVFRLRIVLAERLIPRDLGFYGREKIIGYISKSGVITKEHCGHVLPNREEK